MTAAEPLGSCEPLPVPQAHCVAEDVALPVAAPLLDMVELPVALPVALPVGAVEKVPIVLGDRGIDPVPATLLTQASETTAWNERAMIDAIRRLARHEDPKRWATIDFNPV